MGYTVNWPGVPGGPIEFSFPVHLDYLVPAWRTLNRPGILAHDPRRTIQHENGNTAARARQDSIYLYNGAGGRQASWHGTVDHEEGFVNLPGNEVGWQAGDGAGPGNYNGFAVEKSQWVEVHGTAAQRRQADRNAAEMCGRVGARINAEPPAKRHRDYMVKNCPQYLNASAARWNQYVDDWHHFYNDEKQRMGQPVKAIQIGATVRTTAALNLRRQPSTSAEILRTLPAGTTGAITDGPAHRDDYRWWRLVGDGFNGVVAEDWLEVIDTPKPAPDPEPTPDYADRMPVADLLLTDLNYYDTAPAIRTANEYDFVFVADVIEFTAVTAAAQHAGAGAPAVKAPYKPGERAIAAWLVETESRGWWYVLAGGDDEWVRVPLKNTKRVSDAPLLGDDME